eukprot:COSAG02_NODE_1138_length_14297_cov_4.388537_7_plen_59_part_00
MLYIVRTATGGESVHAQEGSGRGVHIQEKAGLPNDDIVIIWRDSFDRFSEWWPAWLFE